MPLWQTVLGSVSGVITGTVLACVGYYLHMRYIDKDRISLRTVFSVLSGARPKSAWSRELAADSGRKQEAPATPDPGPKPTLFAKAPQEPPFTMREHSQEDASGLFYELERHIASLREGSQASLEFAKTDAPDSSQTVARSLLSDLENDLESIHSRDLAPTLSQQDKIPTGERTPTQASTGDFLQLLFPAQDRSKEDDLGLLAEFEYNIKAIRGLSRSNIVPLRTDAWEGNQPLLRGLPNELRTELEAIYADIALLNNLAWLCSEFNRSSPSMFQEYANLSTSIADRLDNIITGSLFQTAPKEQATGSLEQTFV